MRYLIYIVGKIARNPFRAARSFVKYFTEFRMDRRIGVSTFRRDFTGHSSAQGDSKPCQPVPYSVLAAIAAHIQARGFPLRSFVDVGCGTGRPLAYFSRLGFERMVGIEINQEVAELARANVGRIKPEWNRAGRIEILAADILEAGIDLGGSITYLANPFGRLTMQAFARKLKEQILSRPGQEIALYYALPLHEQALLETFPNAERESIEGIEPCHFFRLDAAALGA